MNSIFNIITCKREKCYIFLFASRENVEDVTTEDKTFAR